MDVSLTTKPHRLRASPQIQLPDKPVRMAEGAAIQELVSFEDVSVSFSPEEWALLHPWQKKLHWEVMMENYKMLISLGNDLYLLSSNGTFWNTSLEDGALAERQSCLANGSDSSLLLSLEQQIDQEKVLELEQDMVLEDADLNRFLCGSPPVLQNDLYLSPNGMSWNTSEEGNGLGNTMPGISVLPGLQQTDHKEDLLLEELSAVKEHNQAGGLYQCSLSKQCFRQKKEFNDHQKRVHMGMKPHACPNCGKAFRDKSDLRVHQRIHTGEKPFACEMCGKTFAQKGNLRTHLKGHMGEKPCSRKEGRKDLQSKGGLGLHQSVQPEERSVICWVCGQSFRDQRELGEHQKAHLEEKAYPGCAPAAQPLVVSQPELGGRSTPVKEEHLGAGEDEVVIVIVPATSPARSLGSASPGPLGDVTAWSEMEEKEDEALPGPSQSQTEGAGAPQREPSEPPAMPPLTKRGRGAPEGSMVWDYFELCPGDPTHAICTHCGVQVSRGKDLRRLSTSGMLKHLRRHHPEIDTPPAGTKLAGPSAGGKAAASRHDQFPAQWLWPVNKQPDHPRPHLITQAIAEMIALDDQPFQVVENAGFHRLLRLLAPEYKIPSRTTFSRRVMPSLYRACREAVSGLLRAAVPDTSVHFTADLWATGSGLHTSFLSLTAHWWGQESEEAPAGSGPVAAAPSHAARHRWALLHVELLDTDHTAEEVLLAMDRQVEVWLSAQPNVHRGFMVTDNSENLVEAAEQLQFASIRCVVHTLNQVVSDALGSSGTASRRGVAAEAAAEHPSAAGVLALVDKCRKIAAYFHRSEKGRRVLKERQLELGLPEHLIPRDVSTRWSSTFLLLQRLQEQELAVRGLAAARGVDVCELSAQEWVLVSEAVLALQPFFVATSVLCAETATLSEALPAALLLEKTMGELQATLTAEEAVALASRLRAGVVDRLREPLGRSAEHVLSCLCDPRMKDTAVTPDQLPRWRALLVEEVRQAQERRLWRRQVEASGGFPSMQPTGTGSSARPGSTVPPEGSKEPLGPPVCSSQWFTQGLLGALPGVREESVRPWGSAERCVLEYLQEPLASQETEPIQFWAAHRQVWPDLATVAGRFLSCPPSSVLSEKVSSMAREVVTPLRSRLDTDLVEQLVFLKANLPLLGYPELAIEGGD